MITHSRRLNNVNRVFDIYDDRKGYVRLDRNEDPVGYDISFFNRWKSQLTIDDIAAYADSKVLVQKLSKWIGVLPEEVYVSAGSDAVIKTLFETYVDPGDIVLMQKPSWRMYDVYSAIYGAKVEYIHYNENFDFDLNELIDKLETQNIRILILANPNQPTGTIISNKDIEKILSIAHKKNTLVIVDEAYYLFCDITAVEYLKKYNNLIIVRTFSKAFGLAGLRIGYSIANTVRIREMMLLRPVTDSSSLAINFSSYLLDNIDVVIDKVKNFNDGRDYIFENLIKNNIKCHKSHGNFLLLPCFDEESAKDLMSFSKSKKYLLKGPFKERPLKDCVRISTGPLNLMKQFWQDCGTAVIQNCVKNN